VEGCLHLAAAGRAAVAFCAGVDGRRGPRRPAELDPVWEPRGDVAAALHADEGFAGRHRLDRLEIEVAPGAARIAGVSGPATGEADAAPAERCQTVPDLDRDLGVAAGTMDRERQAQRRQLAEGGEGHRLQAEARWPLGHRLRTLRQRFARRGLWPNGSPRIVERAEPNRRHRMPERTLAGMAGCGLPPDQHIVPYVKQPDGLVLGKPLHFATVMPFGGDALGLLVESHEGRPTKIDGNPDHPASLGATDAFAQATVLDLYDPDRAKTTTNIWPIPALPQ